ncbi:hypothetical protein L2E82_30553 [Cichorium intybus]|uniref:Uncharacterized protein n=1 Tax=Cichorium intybus TaxID=13427 RepID=A0ACB9D0P2_CICIN|nr:hypothetical protein L2E82_30553 [Cichorium intybus]
MIECPTMGTVNQGFLENLGDVLDIKLLDWCGFVISSFKSIRAMWKSLDDNCMFIGPIVFLLINWTTKMLKDMQLEELSKGGFGNVTISSQHMDMSHCEQEDGEDVDDTTSMRDCPFSEGFTQNVVQQILEKGDDNNSVEYMLLESLAYATIMNAVFLVPKSVHVKLENSYCVLESLGLLESSAYATIMIAVFLLSESVHEKAALAACSKNSKQQSLNPDNRGSHLIIHAGNADPVTVVAPRRTKRHVQPNEKFLSPYFKRVVNPNKVFTSNEERVAGWIFAGLDNEWDLVFESKFGDLGHRGIFESMIPGSKIHATIIDIWASILNHQERHRNKKSPARMFLSCTLLVFFPVIDIKHYYLIVFYFKKHDCVIIDNIKSEVSDEVKYGNIPYDLVRKSYNAYKTNERVHGMDEKV